MIRGKHNENLTAGSSAELDGVRRGNSDSIAYIKLGDIFVRRKLKWNPGPYANPPITIHDFGRRFLTPYDT
jgi:hypothetical protein